jgi:hypothetical protein
VDTLSFRSEGTDDDGSDTMAVVQIARMGG